MWILMNTAMKLRVQENLGYSVNGWNVLVSQQVAWFINRLKPFKIILWKWLTDSLIDFLIFSLEHYVPLLSDMCYLLKKFIFPGKHFLFVHFPVLPCMYTCCIPVRSWFPTILTLCEDLPRLSLPFQLFFVRIVFEDRNVKESHNILRDPPYGDLPMTTI